MKTNRQKIECEIDVPEGYKVVDIREPRSGESYLGLSTGEVLVAGRGYNPSNIRFIVEKIIEYREPRMPDDYGKEIEVRDSGVEKWKEVTLYGIVPTSALKFVTESGPWKCARILVK